MTLRLGDWQWPSDNSVPGMVEGQKNGPPGIGAEP